MGVARTILYGESPFENVMSLGNTEEIEVSETELKEEKLENVVTVTQGKNTLPVNVRNLFDITDGDKVVYTIHEDWTVTVRKKEE